MRLPRTAEAGFAATALAVVGGLTLLALTRPLWYLPIGVVLAGVVFQAWVGVHGQRLTGLLKRWPVRLLPLHVAAAFAAAEPDKVLYYGVAAAALTVVLAGKPHRLGLPDLLAAGLALWAAVTAYGSGAAYGIQSASYYWTACALFVACRQVVTNRERLLSVMTCYVGGSLYVAWMVFNQEPGEVTEYRPEIDGLNINLAAYALVTAIAVVIAVIAMIHPTKAARAGLLAIIAVLGYAVTLTDTRAAIGALMVGVVYLVVRRVTTGAGLLAIGIAVPVILAAVAFNMVDMGNAGWLETPFDRQTGDLSGRLDVWPAARLAWADAPFAGLGPRVFPTTNSMHIGAHNLILTLGVDIGAVGVVLYAAVFIASLLAYRAAGRLRHLGALLLLAWLPIWLTGHWELSPAAWLVLALWTRIPELSARSEERDDLRDAVSASAARA